MKAPSPLTSIYLKDATRESALGSAISDLRRNYPIWPSTFGECSEAGCQRGARASGPCAACCERAIAELTGDPEAAAAYHAAVADEAGLHACLYAILHGEPSCKKCGSTEDPYWSRIEPMGYFCGECGAEFSTEPRPCPPVPEPTSPQS